MKTYIWSLPTRLFHWLLVVGLVVAYFLGEEEELLNIHSSIGYSVGILIIFRIVWGLIGPRYSRFRDFPVSLNSLRSFISDMKKSKSMHHGHNPAASLVMIAIFMITLLIVISGTLLLASTGNGFFVFLNPAIDPEILKETHEILVSILIALVVLHLIGNLVDFIFNRKTGTLTSIFTGYKNLDGKGIRLNSFQVIIAILGIVSALAVLPYSITNQKINNQIENKEISNEANEEDD
jgi:cytochrome b